jgi:hypothetical protein
MIPFLGCLILNRGDLLLRMASSIDYPVDKLAIVQNGITSDVNEAVNQIITTKNPLINTVYLERPFRNMGVCPAWNSIIKSFPEVEYWLIANNDTVFLPGDLEKYHNTWLENKESLIAAANGSFSCFIISPSIIEKIGLFDENIWPIYSEDVEYYIRMQKAGIDRISIQSDIGFSGDGSWTVRSSQQYQNNNNYTQASNQEYVALKWGDNQEHDTPYNEGGNIKDWYYHPARRLRHSQRWNYFEETANKKDINK